MSEYTEVIRTKSIKPQPQVGGKLGVSARKNSVQHKWASSILGLTPLLTLSATILGGRSSLFSLISFVPPLAIISLMGLANVLVNRQRARIWDLQPPKPFLVIVFIWSMGTITSMVLFPLGWKFAVARLLWFALIYFAYINLATIEDFERFSRVYRLSWFGLSLLTLLHAFGIFSLPFAAIVSGRKMFDFLPSRTLGVNMAYGEHGIILSIALALILWELYRGKESEIWNYFLLFTTIFILLITQSRSTILGAAIFFVIVGFGSWVVKIKRQRALFGIIRVVVPLSLIYGISTGIVATLWQDLNEINPGSVFERLDEYKYSVKLIREHPFFGSGYGSFQFLYTQGIFLEALHNFFLHEIVSLGLIIGSIPVVLFAWLTFMLHKQLKVESYYSPLIIFLGASIAFSIIELNLFMGFYVEALAVLIGLCMAISKQQLQFREHTE